MTWIIILIVVGGMFFFLSDRDKMLKQQVDEQGGMKKKYAELIDWLTSDPNARIIKITRDHVHISMVMQTTATHFFITEIFNGVVVEWNAKLGLMGDHKKKWKFLSTTSNEQMIEIIGTDINEYSRRIM